MKLVKVEDVDLAEIEGNRCRTFRAVSNPLTASVILGDIQQKSRRRVIVICNTVSQSQGLFQDLKAADLNGDLEIMLLHSRFLPEDRANKETYLQATFAEKTGRLKPRLHKQNPPSRVSEWANKEKTGRLKPRLHKQNPPSRVEEQEKTGRLKPRLHKQNPPSRVEEQEKTGRLKPRLHKQNPPSRVEEWAVEITLSSSVCGGGLRLSKPGFNRRLICQVLIATQVIEAGLNITCEVMHSHLCPMNSLLQRAGRCARFRGEKGEVFVYRSFELSQLNSELAAADSDESEAENIPQKSRKFLPYDDDICEVTWQVLLEHSQSETADRPVGFRTEEQWIDRVHTAEDSLQARRRQNDRSEFDRKFNAAVFQGDRSFANDLIRLVDNRSIFVWEEASFIDCDSEQIDPKKLLPFSVPATTLCKVWREVQNLEYQIDWIFKRIEYPASSSAETYNLPICTPIRSTSDLLGSLQILVNSRYIHYDSEVGLVIGAAVVGSGFASPEKAKKQVASEYKYRMDNYVGHLVLMGKCWREPFLAKQLRNGKVCEVKYGSVRDELLPAGGRFMQSKIFPAATAVETAALFEYLVFLAIFTHDLGKLQVKWQQVMRGWQEIARREFGGRNPKSELLAHTDYDPGDRENLDSQGRTQKQALQAWEKQHKRPNHAVESAFLSREILKQVLVPLLAQSFEADREQIQDICHAVILAAGRHHSAWAKGWLSKDVAKMTPMQLHRDAQRAIDFSWRNLIRFLPKTLPISEEAPKLSRNSYDAKVFDLDRFEVDKTEYLQLYSLVVRALRLCDARSVQL